jgi:hypothetical protein
MSGFRRPPGEWSTLYDTPVYRLLFLCGLKRSFTVDGRPVWTIRRKPKEL